MENQHRQIKGYRELSEEDIRKMNEIKALGERLGVIVGNLAMDGTVDTRWVAIGKTHLQQGIMALVRAIAQPTTF
jgi:hypothetical protein